MPPPSSSPPPLADFISQFGSITRALGAGLLSPNTPKEADALLSHIFNFLGQPGPPGVSLGMMPMGPAPINEIPVHPTILKAVLKDPNSFSDIMPIPRPLNPGPKIPGGTNIPYNFKNIPVAEPTRTVRPQIDPNNLYSRPNTITPLGHTFPELSSHFNDFLRSIGAHEGEVTGRGARFANFIQKHLVDSPQVDMAKILDSAKKAAGLTDAQLNAFNEWLHRGGPEPPSQALQDFHKNLMDEVTKRAKEHQDWANNYLRDWRLANPEDRFVIEKKIHEEEVRHSQLDRKTMSKADWKDASRKWGWVTGLKNAIRQEGGYRWLDRGKPWDTGQHWDTP